MGLKKLLIKQGIVWETQNTRKIKTKKTRVTMQILTSLIIYTTMVQQNIIEVDYHFQNSPKVGASKYIDKNLRKIEKIGSKKLEKRIDLFVLLDWFAWGNPRLRHRSGHARPIRSLIG